MRRMHGFLLAACSVLVMVSAAAGAPAVTDLLARAEAAVESAEAMTDPSERASAYDEAIAAYLAVLDSGVENAAVHRNIGTLFVLKGDVGRAIASLRRADRLDPRDPRVQDSLTAARAMVRSEVTSGVRTRAADAAFFWRGVVPRSTILWIGGAGWVLLWAGLIWRFGFVRSGSRGIGLALVGGLVCVIAIGSLVGERVVTVLNPAGVVVQDGVTGYRGPSDGVYEPSFTEPIRAGVEGAILEQRDGWVRLRLRSGVETWVRASAIEVV